MRQRSRPGGNRAALFLTALIMVPVAAAGQGSVPTATDDSVRKLIAVVRNPRTSSFDAAEAIEALGELGPKAVPAIPAILARVALEAELDDNTDDRDLPGVPSEAAGALARMGPTILPELKTALRTRYALVRWVAIEAISLLGQDAVSAIPDLKHVVVDTWSDPASRLTPETDAAKAIARLGAVGLPTLIQLLHERRADVRMMTLLALPSYSGAGDTLVPLLLDGLRDGNPFVRQYAISTVRRIKPVHPDVRAALQEVARTDPDAHTREHAEATLKALGGGP